MSFFNRKNDEAQAAGTVVLAGVSLRDRFARRLASVFGRKAADAAFMAELEEALVTSDVGLDVTERLMALAKGEVSVEGVREKVRGGMLAVFRRRAAWPALRPQVILVVGVNGVGKTTTIAKLAADMKRQGKSVVLVAADTFRAAAVEQLGVWGERLGFEVVAQGGGADPAAVAFDGVARAKADGADAVIIDTAGRLHTKKNLMDELSKICRVVGKAMDGAPHERLIVIDATVGANGLIQARMFDEAVKLTGAIVTKLDGTAKGGVVLAVAGELGIPITHIGVGEGLDDLKPFDANSFVFSIIGD
jgi:fused signal recognition particle receptor